MEIVFARGSVPARRNRWTHRHSLPDDAKPALTGSVVRAGDGQPRPLGLRSTVPIGTEEGRAMARFTNNARGMVAAPRPN